MELPPTLEDVFRRAAASETCLETFGEARVLEEMQRRWSLAATVVEEALNFSELKSRVAAKKALVCLGDAKAVLLLGDKDSDDPLRGWDGLLFADLHEGYQSGISYIEGMEKELNAR